MNIWERQPSETPKAFAAFGLYLNIPPLGRSVRAAVELFRKQGGKTSERNWETWASRYNWRNRAAEHDSDLASRRRERMAQELEWAQDDAFVLIQATLAKVKERIEGVDPEELSAGQIPAALRTLIELEFKVLGYEDRVVLTGKDGGPVKVDTKTQHVFQPTQEAWDEVVRIRTEYERLRDGGTDEETASDSF